MKNFLKKYLPIPLGILLIVGSLYFRTQKALAGPPAFIGTQSAQCNASCTATTGGLNTGSADFCVAGVLEFVADPATGTMSDSAGNTWHHLTTVNNSTINNTEIVFWYTYNGVSAFITNTSDTFSFVGTSYPTMIVSCYSGVATATDPFDKENGLITSGTTNYQTGSVTPTVNNELLVSLSGDFSGTNGNSYTIDSGFTTTGNAQNNNNLIVVHAYYTQPTAGAINPTWTAFAGNHEAIIASFQPLPAASGPTVAPAKVSLPIGKESIMGKVSIP
jgi:hypothetical protein